jgi:hypothetical protein
MKLILFLTALFISSACFATTGKLIAEGYYLDNINQSVSPALALQVAQPSVLSSHIDLVGSLGLGYEGLPADQFGNTPNPYYVEGLLDASYAFSKGWALDVGGGLVSNSAIYHQFDDYLHASVSYNLW